MPDTQTNAAVVIDTSHSPHARLRPVPVNAVMLTDSFWAPRLAINRTVTIPSQCRHLEATGTLDNFRRASGKKDVPFSGGFPFMDSDVYKWLEAACWALATGPHDYSLRAMVDGVIAEVAAAQRPDGYLNTFFSRERAGERWTNLRDQHELYCAGHFFQAAVAHHRATGEAGLLAVATRFADHLCDTFGPIEEGKRPGTCGHPEVEMALVELSRVAGERRYLELARHFIDARGADPSALAKVGAPSDFDRRYFQDHVPFRALSEVTGHAVRMVYLACGATDLYAETGEAALKLALDRQWAGMTERRMYVTGGLGARHEGEAFGGDYELPSDRAYAETCAAIAGVMWNHRLLQLTGEAKYADVMELALYNGVLSGLSLDGAEYFYVNPLADDGAHRRQPWFGCACCPPNVARLLASLPGYFYSVADDAVYVHLYATGMARIVLPGGDGIVLKQETNYPWGGEITLTIEEMPEKPLGLHLRVPAWAGDRAMIALNDTKPFGVNKPGGYIPLPVSLKAGDEIRLTLPMRPHLVTSHPRVDATYDKAAIVYGPLIYCLEQADHIDVDVRDVVLPSEVVFTPEFAPELLGGVIRLTGGAWELRHSGLWEDALYQPLRDDAKLGEDRVHEDVIVTAVPYYAWANREPGAMRVWLPMG